MSVAITSVTLCGLEALKVVVEVDTYPGLPFFGIVGLPDKSVEESKDRIETAIKNSGFVSPRQKRAKVVVNLAPADRKKEGTLLDLPIALGFLVATRQIIAGQIPPSSIFVGELSLDGSLRPVRGALSIAMMAENLGFSTLFTSVENAKEAALIKGIKARGASDLKTLLAHLGGKQDIIPTVCNLEEFVKNYDKQKTELDFAYIKGQETAKRAMIIAAAGGHNVLMSGPPGAGKTILARALWTILPPLNYEETLEVMRIYSIAGGLRFEQFTTERPFRDPHHTTSPPAIIGGGNNPRPGEISLAHRGILFLDELPEFPRNVLEALRQPLEDGKVTVARVGGYGVFPAKFMFIGAMNPCPCGNFGSDQLECICVSSSVTKYRKKISGPLLDRIDMHVFVPRETANYQFNSEEQPLTSATAKQVVLKARDFQKARLAKLSVNNNAEIKFKDLSQFCLLAPEAKKFLEFFIEKNQLSVRGYHRILKVGRTIADLRESEIINLRDISEAANFKLAV